MIKKVEKTFDKKEKEITNNFIKSTLDRIITWILA